MIRSKNLLSKLFLMFATIFLALSFSEQAAAAVPSRSCDLNRLGLGLTKSDTESIQFAYCLVLGRYAEINGMGHWLSYYNANKSKYGFNIKTFVKRDLVQALLTSQEGRDRHKITNDNKSITKALYNSVLSRNPDAAGEMHWLEMLGALSRTGLNNGGRIYIVAPYFTTSGEFTSKYAIMR